jgi:NitT/TauT family transport system ATP-binding protein
MSPSPGRIKEVIEIPFERPRCRKTLGAQPEYLALKSHLLSVLYCEMLDDLDRQLEEPVAGGTPA